MTTQKSGNGTPVLPGLLSDPTKILRDDERIDRRLIEALEPFELDGLPADPPVDHSSNIEELLTFCSDVETIV